MSIRDLTPWTRGRKPALAEGDYHPIQTLHERMDRLFDDFFAGFELAPFGRTMANGGFLAPRIDVSEGDKEYRFSAELPGVDEKDVEVTLSNGVLTIKGEKKSESKEEKDNFLRAERSYGAFQRAFSLPADIDEDKVDAAFSKGVLTVTIAKNAAAKTVSKRIHVKKAA